MKAVDAEKKAQTVFNTGKQVLREVSAMGENTYEGIKVSNDGVNYFITVKDLKTLGYEVGSGCLVGLPEQTIDSLADDILFFKELVNV